MLHSWRRWEIYTKFWLENLKKRDHLEDRHRFEDNIKMDLKANRLHGVDWIYVAQDRDHCQFLINMVMNLWVP
jgi:hypothetical protein